MEKESHNKGRGTGRIRFKLEIVRRKKLLAEYYKTRNPEIKEILLRDALNLVYFCATELLKKNNSYDMDDLVSTGLLHLEDILDRYNPNEGEFSTYACKSLKGYMMRRIGGSTLSQLSDVKSYIPIPFCAGEDIIAISKVVMDYEKEHNNTPTPKYISDKLGIKLNRIYEVLNIMKNPVNFNDVDLMVADESEEIFKEMTRDEYKSYFYDCLNDKELYVLFERFGIVSREPRTLESIGNELGYTREGIRQIADKALRKMRVYFMKNKVKFEDNLFISELNNQSFINKNANDEYTYNDQYYEGWTPEEFEEYGISYR